MLARAARTLARRQMASFTTANLAAGQLYATGGCADPETWTAVESRGAALRVLVLVDVLDDICKLCNHFCNQLRKQHGRPYLPGALHLGVHGHQSGCEAVADRDAPEAVIETGSLFFVVQRTNPGQAKPG